MVRPKGISHIGLCTLDLDKTREFYENVLGFKPVICDEITIKEGGRIRHIFFDTGHDQLIAFMEPRGVPGIPQEFDPSFTRSQGLPAAFLHFAFEVGNDASLRQKREELLASNVEVSEVVDHDWAKSIYFRDPSGNLLEFCYLTREFNEDDVNLQPRFEVSVDGPLIRGDIVTWQDSPGRQKSE